MLETFIPPFHLPLLTMMCLVNAVNMVFNVKKKCFPGTCTSCWPGGEIRASGNINWIIYRTEMRRKNLKSIVLSWYHWENTISGLFWFSVGFFYPPTVSFYCYNLSARELRITRKYFQVWKVQVILWSLCVLPMVRCFPTLELREK